MISPKTYITLLVAVVAIGILIFALLKLGHTGGGGSAESGHNNPHIRAQEEGISPRQAQIENYKDFSEEFPSAQFGDNLLHLVTYPPSFIDKVQNFPDEKYGGRGGLLVLNGDKIIWESNENFQELYDESSKFEDLTGDGIQEIVVVDEGGGNEPGCATSVYKWSGSGFNLITPEYVSPCEGSDASRGGFKDVDGDGIFELIGFRMDWDDPSNPQVDKRTEIEVTYKFDGTKYTLWREAVVNP